MAFRHQKGPDAIFQVVSNPKYSDLAHFPITYPPYYDLRTRCFRNDGRKFLNMKRERSRKEGRKKRRQPKKDASDSESESSDESVEEVEENQISEAEVRRPRNEYHDTDIHAAGEVETPSTLPLSWIKWIATKGQSPESSTYYSRGTVREPNRREDTPRRIRERQPRSSDYPQRATMPSVIYRQSYESSKTPLRRLKKEPLSASTLPITYSKSSYCPKSYNEEQLLDHILNIHHEALAAIIDDRIADKLDQISDVVVREDYEADMDGVDYEADIDREAFEDDLGREGYEADFDREYHEADLDRGHYEEDLGREGCEADFDRGYHEADLDREHYEEDPQSPPDINPASGMITITCARPVTAEPLQHKTDKIHDVEAGIKLLNIHDKELKKSIYDSAVKTDKHSVDPTNVNERKPDIHKGSDLGLCEIRKATDSENKNLWKSSSQKHKLTDTESAKQTRLAEKSQVSKPSRLESGKESMSSSIKGLLGAKSSDYSSKGESPLHQRDSRGGMVSDVDASTKGLNTKCVPDGTQSIQRMKKRSKLKRFFSFCFKRQVSPNEIQSNNQSGIRESKQEYTQSNLSVHEPDGLTMMKTTKYRLHEEQDSIVNSVKSDGQTAKLSMPVTVKNQSKYSEPKAENLAMRMYDEHKNYNVTPRPNSDCELEASSDEHLLKKRIYNELRRANTTEQHTFSDSTNNALDDSFIADNNHLIEVISSQRSVKGTFNSPLLDLKRELNQMAVNYSRQNWFSSPVGLHRDLTSQCSRNSLLEIFSKWQPCVD